MDYSMLQAEEAERIAALQRAEMARRLRVGAVPLPGGSHNTPSTAVNFATSPANRTVSRGVLPDGRPVVEGMVAGMGAGAEAIRPPLPATPTPTLPGPPRDRGDIVAPSAAGPFPTEQVTVGERAGNSPLGRVLARERALRRADPTSKVADAPGFGTEILPPMANPKSTGNRVKQALIGVLQGAAIAAQGPTEGAAMRALGGAGVGAATGAISPRLMMALTRDQEINRASADSDRAMTTTLGQARIEETLAEAQQRRATAASKRTNARYIERKDGVYEVSDEFPEGRRVGDIPAEPVSKKAARRYFEREDGVYYTDDEDDPVGKKLKGVPGKPNTAGAARTAKTAGERRSATVRAERFRKTANDHLSKRAEIDAGISELERELTSLDTKKRSDGQPWKEKIDAQGNRSIDDPEYTARKARLEKQLERARKDSEYRQTQADQAFEKAVEAEADLAGAEAEGGIKGRMARSKLKEAARRLKMTEAEAEEYLTNEGYEIY